MRSEIVNAGWFQYLEQPQQQLVLSSFELIERERTDTRPEADHSYIVFPAAKAFEGFLKQYFHDLGLISTKTYEGRRFRIGRAINPDVRTSHRDEYWLFDDVTQACGEDLARQLWETWLTCRNRVFHYFPKNVSTLSLQEAEEYVVLLLQAMESAVQCRADELLSDKGSL